MINGSSYQMVGRAVAFITVIRASPSHHQMFSLFFIMATYHCHLCWCTLVSARAWQIQAWHWVGIVSCSSILRRNVRWSTRNL